MGELSSPSLLVPGNNLSFAISYAIAAPCILPRRLHCIIRTIRTSSAWLALLASVLQKQDVEPFAVHANLEFGGAAAKRQRLREAGLWYDAPDYYDSGRFVELKLLTVLGRPEGFLNWTSPRMAEYHHLAMRSQLEQVARFHPSR